MKKIYIPSYLSAFLFILTILFFSSCGSTKNVPYFQNVLDTGESKLKITSRFQEPVIQVDDILSISIFTIDPTTSMIVNQLNFQNSSGASTINNGPSNIGFLIDKDGFVQIPVIGKIHLAGYTTIQAKDTIEKIAYRSFNNPSVQVRFNNFKVTILGEVGRPATYTISSEKLSVLDALGLAGDLTVFGKRENVLLIRENDGDKKFVRLNLNSTNIFDSPYFYLKQNDVLYIEPNKGKAASLNAARTQTLALIGTALTVLITLIARM